LILALGTFLEGKRKAKKDSTQKTTMPGKKREPQRGPLAKKDFPLNTSIYIKTTTPANDERKTPVK